MTPSRKTPAVPEVAVYEDGYPCTAEYDVGRTGKVPHVLAKAETPRVQGTAHGDFDTRVLAANVGHRASPLLGREAINCSHHEATPTDELEYLVCPISE